jgi:hypothetical protein
MCPPFLLARAPLSLGRTLFLLGCTPFLLLPSTLLLLRGLHGRVWVDVRVGRGWNRDGVCSADAVGIGGLIGLETSIEG